MKTDYASDKSFDGRVPAAAVPRNEFLHAMRHAVTGVNILTTDGRSGRFGVTISAMSSVSADPPLVLACVNKTSPICPAITTNGVFCINILAATQTHVADSFAGRGRNRYDFDCAEWSSDRTGAPCLVGAVAAFDCALSDVHEAGSHLIFIGRVLSACDADGAPLLYTASTYGQPDLFAVSI